MSRDSCRPVCLAFYSINVNADEAARLSIPRARIDVAVLFVYVLEYNTEFFIDKSNDNTSESQF